MNIQGFLSACGGRASGKSSEWVFDCWKCSGKEKLYFNTSKLIGYCQKCNSVVSLKTLAFELGGISLHEIQKFVEEAAYNDKIALGFKESVLTGLIGESQSAAITPKTISLPSTFRTLKEGQTSVIGRQAIAYMENRGFDLERLFELDFGYCSGGFYANRIIIPFWESGRVVYWQARDFTKKVPASEKILNPPASSVDIGKSSVLFNYDDAKHKHTIVVCESWGSALATGRAAIGLNGKTMSLVQMNKILSMDVKNIIVLLDHGAEYQAWDIASRLSRHLKDVFLAFLPYGDPNEVPKHVVLQAIRFAQPYTVTGHIKYRAECLAVF